MKLGRAGADFCDALPADLFPSGFHFGFHAPVAREDDPLDQLGPDFGRKLAGLVNDLIESERHDENEVEERRGGKREV